MKDSQRKIIDCATENYVAQASLYSGLLADAYQAVNAQVKIVDMRAASEKFTMTTARSTYWSRLGYRCPTFSSRARS